VPERQRSDHDTAEGRRLVDGRGMRAWSQRGHQVRQRFGSARVRNGDTVSHTGEVTGERGADVTGADDPDVHTRPFSHDAAQGTHSQPARCPERFL
jgi:hypothetical protein